MIQKVVGWLQLRLANQSASILIAQLFGSIPKGSTTPSDCDVLIVSDAGPDSAEWHALRSHVKEIERPFLQEFGIPLSVLLMTAEEFRSLSAFIETLPPTVDILVRVPSP